MSKLSHMRLVSAELDLDPLVQVKSVRGVEALGQLYALDVALTGREGALTAEVLRAPLTLELAHAGDAAPTRMHGIASSVHDDLAAVSGDRHHRLVFVPRMWRLSLTRTSEIFMGLSVAEIISAKLERYGLKKGTDFELRLQGSYPAREYVVQYQETDLHFVQRLAEHWGITLFFQQGDAHEVAVFTDHADGFNQVASVPFVERGDDGGVYELRRTMRTLPTQHAVKDYNYRTPQIAVVGASPIDTAGVGHVYEYGDHVQDTDEAKRFAAIRAEERACQGTTFEGTSSEMRLSPGTRVQLEGHPMGEPELLVTKVTHDFSQPTMLHDGADATGYRNTLTALPALQPFRPPRVTPKPRINGCITAQVESSGDGPYAQLDEEGRYHVRFMFDIGGGDRGKATRLVRMAQPHTGPGYGMHFPLRHGVEVLITFIDGDPDRPIISAAVPNPQTPSVVTSKNGARNIIRTGGGNEINIDDTLGSERIKLSTPFGGSSFQIGAPNAPSAGAALSTADAWNAVAEGGATTASTAVSIFSDVASIMASTDIVAFAGAANILDALAKKAPDLAKKVAEVVSGGIDTAEKFEAAQVNDAKVAAKEERNEAERERSRKRQWENKHPEWTTAPPSFDQKIAQHEAAATAHDRRAEELEAQKASNDDARAGVKDAANKTKTGAKLAKAGNDAWSAASKLSSKASGTAAAAAAGMAAAAGSGFAAAGRIGGSVPEPGSPKNIQAAASSAALIGLSNAMVAGINTGCVGSSQAILAGGGKALVKSPGQAEIAGMARCLMTSGALVDIKSYAVLKTAATGAAKHTAGSLMSIYAGGTLKMRSSVAANLKAPAINLKGFSTVSVKAPSITEKASGALTMSGGTAALKANTALDMTAGGKATMKGGTALVKSAGTEVILGKSGMHLKAADIQLKSSGPVNAQGTNVTIKGSGMIKLNAATIKANGRVLLG